MGAKVARLCLLAAVCLAASPLVAQRKPAQPAPPPAKAPAPPAKGAPPPAKAPTPPPKPATPPAKPLESKVVADPTQAATIDFINDVEPVLVRYGCAQGRCHGAYTGRGGLKLSLFGNEPEFDFDVLTRAAGGRRLNRVEPKRSLLVLKATGALPHEGGKKVAADSADYEALVSWVAQGAVLLSTAERVRPTRLSVAPAEQLVIKGRSAEIRAVCSFSDGASKEVTAEATYRSTDPSVATVDDGGKVTAKNHGQCAIIVIYRGQYGGCSVIVPHLLPSAGFPKLVANNKIDELVHARLKLLGMPPADLCSDQVFLRRAYLDVIGVLPSPEEARAFLADQSADRRAKLIDSLLAREEFVDFATLKWGDLLRIKSEYPVKVWPKAVQAYFRYVRQSIADNKPYDQFVRELLLSTGSNFRSGEANFYRAVPTKDPQSYAETVSLLFMGARLGCARCHGHPYESWTLDDNLGMAAFFAKVKLKATQEWKEEVVYLDPEAVFNHPRSRKPITPKFLGGLAPVIEPGTDPRELFVAWLTAPQNPWFARNVANRVWSWLLGRGIVHEPDDMRPSNPASNPPLLDYLATELTNARYDLRALYRLILNSRTYQLASGTNEQNRADTSQFSHYPVKRLTAEQLLDAVNQVTGNTETFWTAIPEPYSRLPRDTRAVQVYDGSIENGFLELFGRPPRDTPFESERCSRTSMRQATYMMSSSEIENKIGGGTRLKRLLSPSKPGATAPTDAEVIEEIYLCALSRPPSAAERKGFLAHLAKDPKNRAQAVQDVLWAVLNSKEFLFIR
jgi:hypothetical protein